METCRLADDQLTEETTTTTTTTTTSSSPAADHAPEFRSINTTTTGSSSSSNAKVAEKIALASSSATASPGHHNPSQATPSRPKTPVTPQRTLRSKTPATSGGFGRAGAQPPSRSGRTSRLEAYRMQQEMSGAVRRAERMCLSRQEPGRMSYLHPNVFARPEQGSSLIYRRAQELSRRVMDSITFEKRKRRKMTK